MEKFLLVVSVIQGLISFGTLCGMLYAFKKFLDKPHDSLEERVTKLEARVDNAEEALHKGNDKFRNHGEALETLLSCSLALVEFEIQYCVSNATQPSQDLQKAKEQLHEYLTRVKR